MNMCPPNYRSSAASVFRRYQHDLISYQNTISYFAFTILYYNLQQKCCGKSPWVKTYGFPLLLLFNVGAAISSSPPLLNVGKKVLLLYEFAKYTNYIQSVTKCCHRVFPCYPSSMLVLWGIFCYSNNNRPSLTYIE